MNTSNINNNLGGGAVTSYMIVSTFKSGKVIYLPTVPETISDSLSATWATQAIVSRSMPIVAYAGTDMNKVSFSLKFHREMETHGSSVEEVLQAIRASVYPKYASIGNTPPITFIRFGDYSARGYVTSLNFKHDSPIIQQKYPVITVDIQMDRTPPSVVGGNFFENTTSSNPYNNSGI